MYDKKDCPCIACPRRTAICHAQCVEYHTWAAALRARKFAARDKYQGERDANRRVIDGCIFQRKRRHDMKRK